MWIHWAKAHPLQPLHQWISMSNLKSNLGCLLSLFLTFTAPTLPPTTLVPSTTPSDECDDDQASCHSGTGDDYDVTGANIALMRLQNALLPFLLLWLTLRCSLWLELPSTVHTCKHACNFAWAVMQTVLIGSTCSSHLFSLSPLTSTYTNSQERIAALPPRLPNEHMLLLLKSLH